MAYNVTLETVVAVPIAAARRRVMIPQITSAWKPALDQVWALLRAHPELEPGGNVFLYHHPTRREDPMDIDFGVQVGGEFPAEGEVFCTKTPAGQVATTLHRGPYDGLSAAHNAIHGWCSANGKQIGGESWEIYSDWNDDQARLETRIMYLLR